MYQAIIESIKDCIYKDGYKVHIAASSDRHNVLISLVEEAVKDLSLNDFIESIRKNKNCKQYRMTFKNGSHIQIDYPTESCRGYKFNTLFVEEDELSYDIVRCVLYPCLMPHYRRFEVMNTDESPKYIIDEPKRYNIKFISIKTEEGEIVCPTICSYLKR